MVMDDPVENTKTAPVDVDEVVAAAMRSDPNLEYLVRGLIGAAHRRGWDAALDASTAMLDLDIGAYEAGARYEHERIERLIMGHDPIEPSDRAYLLELIKRK